MDKSKKVARNPVSIWVASFVGSLKFVLLVSILSLCAACSGTSPGPLEGAWDWKGEDGAVLLHMEFRNGECESWGGVERVTYKVDGERVTMTYRDSLLAGTSIEYVVSGDTARTANILMRRVSNRNVDAKGKT